MKKMPALVLFGLLISSPVTFHSCLSPVYSEKDADIDSNKGLAFRFTDTTNIDRIDFVGTGRYKIFNSRTAAVTLNPADTVCSFEIHYKGASGIVKIRYNPYVEYTDDGTIKVIQRATIDSSTFGRVVFVEWYDYLRRDIPIIEITR